MSLASKSLTELRGLAQSLNIADVFQKDKTQLLQAIDLKQAQSLPLRPESIPMPTYDARLMNMPPAKRTDATLIEEYLKHHIQRGLKVTFDEERWYMSFDKRTDEGTLRMPPRVVIKCADRVLLG